MREIPKTKLRALCRDERGASIIDYSILIAIITAATIATIVLVGGKVSTAWTTLDTNWK